MPTAASMAGCRMGAATAATTTPVAGAAGGTTPVQQTSGGGGTDAAAGAALTQPTQLVAALQRVVDAITQLVKVLGQLPAGTLGANGAPTAAAPPTIATSAPVAANGSAPAASPTASTDAAQPAAGPVTVTAASSAATAGAADVRAGGGAPVAPTSAATSSAREGVLLIGDSLTVGVRDMGDMQPKLGNVPLTIDAKGGISLKEGMRRYDAHKAAGELPRVVEIGLFTNNSPNQINELKTAIEKTVADARARGGRVVWATIVRPNSGGKSYDEVNQLIRSMAQNNSDVMGLVDWQAMVAAKPGLVGSDHVHSGKSGYQVRAQAYADAARA